MSGVFNVLSYGAVGDGVTDDTVAIRSAITAAAGGGAVYLPWTAGGYLINSAATLSLPLISNIRVFGDGPTRIINGSSTADVFQINVVSGNVEIDHLQIQMKAGVTATAGWMLNLASTGILWVQVHDVICNATWGGVGSTITSGNINNVTIHNCFFNTMVGRGIQLYRGIDWFISNTLITMASAGAGIGILIESGSDGTFTNNVRVLKGNPAILFRHTLGSGEPPRHSYFARTVATDSGTAAWKFSDGHRIHLDQCRAATQVTGASGIIVDAPTRNLEFENCSVQNNAQYGYLINGGLNIGIVGGEVLGNSKDTNNTYDGIICGSPTGVRIIGVRSTNDSDFNGLQRYGVRIMSTTAQVTVQGCDLRGNQTGWALSSSPTGIITNNLM